MRTHRLADAASAFTSNARNPDLRRAQLSFLGAWTAEWAFTVALGSTVSNGVPAAGAGNLETIASRDVYRFSVSAATTMQYEHLSGVKSFLLRNVEAGERSATVYAARASRSPDGSYAVGDAGSSPYVSYERRDVTLAEGEQREERG